MIDQPDTNETLSPTDKRNAITAGARAERDAHLAAIAEASPWLRLREASAYAKRGRRVLRKAVQGGRLRAAVIGERRELIFRRDWIDAWLSDLAVPVPLPMRRHG
jgi:hypothetical protein